MNVVSLGEESEIIPNEYVIPYIEKGEDAVVPFSVLPSSYNTSTAKNYVSPVKNQNPLGTCWDFATISVLESSLLKRNTEADNSKYDFSENHVRYATSNRNGNIYGFDRDPDGGGNFNMVRAYLTRGIANGPVDETDDPYDYLSYSNGGTRTLEETESYPKDDVYVKDTIELSDLPTGYTESQRAARIEEIKEMVHEYGSVYLCTAINGSNMNYSTYSYYNSEPESITHAVAIVGWDDNYAVSNFKTSQQPNYPGAFLIKNSWGPGWGLNGYYYMSYECANNFPGIATISDVDNRDFYDNLYEYDELGKGGMFGYGKAQSVLGANVYSRQNKNDEYLTAVSTYINADDSYVKVYACDGDDFTKLREVNILNQGSKSNLGYYVKNAGSVTLEIADDIYLSEDKYIVAVELYNENYPFMMSTETTPQATNLQCQQGQSYYASSINNMRTNPIVMSTGSDNICLKSFTKNVKNVEEMWNFSNEQFSNITNLTNTREYNGLTLNGTTSIPIRFESNNRYINGWQYNRALILNENSNGAVSSNGTVEIDVCGPTEIYIAAKAYSDSSPDESELHVYNSNGIEILPIQNPYLGEGVGTFSFQAGADVKKYVYNENSFDKIRISAGAKNMKIYSIAVRTLNDKDTMVVNEYFNITTTNSHPWFDFTNGVHVQNYNVRNEYGTLFTQYADLEGRGTIYSNSIRMYTPSNTDIYISARTTGDLYEEERQLAVVNKYGYLIGYVKATNSNTNNNNVHIGSEKLIGSGSKVLTFHFPYIGDTLNGEDLYIMSFDCGINIYDVKIKTRNQTEPGIDENLSMRFDSDFFDDYVGNITSELQYNDRCKISATSSKPVRIENKTVSCDDETYTRRLLLQGQGASDYRNVKINVDGNVHITVVANHLGTADETRELALFDENGYICAYVDLIGNTVYKAEFDYIGGANTLYLRSKEYSMNLYSITVSDISSTDTGSGISLTALSEADNEETVYKSDSIVSGAAISITDNTEVTESIFENVSYYENNGIYECVMNGESDDLNDEYNSKLAIDIIDKKTI